MGCFLSLIHNQINELTVGKQGNHSKILSYKISKYIFTYELLRSLRLCFLLNLNLYTIKPIIVPYLCIWL